ncbi:hypothetical protein PT974_06107 [Cladobotryum mycophilum]|uniref:Uncharacterized protein n=1 Tax=Cladobotryum mycophilum TaxID=491253 RepID=A0ABR0SKK7_9HYPO
MPLSTRSRARRPAIAPIQTGNNELSDRSRLQSIRRSSPRIKAIRSETPVSPRHVEPKFSNAEPSQHEKMRLDHREVLQKFEILNVASPGGALTTPLGTRWTVAGIHPSTPVTAVAIQPCFVVPVIEVHATREETEMLSGRRQSAPCCGSAIGQLNFQKFREDLWKRGAQSFGNAEDADVFVKPLQLPRPSEEPTDNGVSPLSSPESGHLTVRAVVRSKERAAVGLKRHFELEKLRATLPEPLPSPNSPNFDREALLSALRTPSSNNYSPRVTLSPPMGNERRSSGYEGVKMEPDDGSPCSTLHSPGPIAVPMHTRYARAQLPALAAIMMSDKVRRGDTIDLPVPHPGAWAETVGYVYTGEEELLTWLVRENILYLGGRV